MKFLFILNLNPKSLIFFISAENFLIFKMILSLVAFIGVDAVSLSPKAPGDCYWAIGESGDFLECLPEFYIKGGCESGSRSDCKLGKNILNAT